MSLERLAGVIIIVGVAIYILAGVVSPSLYNEPDIDQRAQIVRENQTRWDISQTLFGLGLIVPAVGLLVFTLHLHNTQKPWAIYVGAVAFALGALVGVVFVYRQTSDPVQYWEGSQPPSLILGAVALILLGLLFYGVAFLHSEYSNRIGYLAVGMAVALMLVFVLTSGTTGFVVASASYLVVLVMGIVLII